MDFPHQFDQIADSVEVRGNKIAFRLKCVCGGKLFTVAACRTRDDNNPFDRYWCSLKLPVFSVCSATEKETGKAYFYGKTFFGIHIGKYYADDMPASDPSVTVAKVKCAECGKEYVLFDSRIHGYDAVANQSEGRRGTESLPQALHFQWEQTPAEMQVSIDYAMSLSELSEEFEQTVGEEDLLNAFSGIEIFRIVGKKKKRWFSEETA